MLHAIKGAWTYFEYFLVLLLFLPIMAVVRLLNGGDPVYRRPGRVMRSFGRVTGWLQPLWKLTWDGAPPADVKKRAYVVISNHESTADIFLLTWLPWDMRWIAKEELFETPFVGWALRLCGDIRIRRGDKESVVKMLDECRSTLENGMPLMLFPEGTRSKDGAILPFKDGAFQLAIETQSPILPIAIAGTRKCMPKHSLWFGATHAHARLLEPIPTAGLSLADLPRLKDEVRARIARCAQDIRGELGLEYPQPAWPLPAVAAETPAALLAAGAEAPVARAVNG